MRLVWFILAIGCAAAHSNTLSAKGGGSLHTEVISSIANHTAQMSDLEFGDLTCMRWTGGSCAMFSCSTERGPTECEAGYCMCQQGLCADAVGTCVRQRGKWLGAHAIRFKNPYDRAKPYLGVGDSIVTELDWDSSRSLAATSSSQPSWNIALTPGGHLRFESMAMPGSAIHFYKDRRRRSRRSHNFLQEASTQSKKAANTTLAQVTSDSQGQEETRHKAAASIPDDDDLWPVLVSIKKASPLSVTFRARPTHKNGGGLEIWDPQTGHALASANAEWFSADHVARNGIAECLDVSDLFSISDCEGRQLVQFDPELPMEATPIIARNYISAIGVLNWWQAILVLVCICGPMCGIAAVLSEMQKRESS